MCVRRWDIWNDYATITPIHTSVEFEVLTMVAMKSSIFRDITPCSPVKSQPVFQRNISPPSSGSKSKSHKKPA
jgi:hypothetical protein